MPCRLSSLLLARHVPPQRSIQIYRSVLEILLVIFEFARKKNGDKMFRVQTHQVLLTCNLTCTLRIAISWHLARQISRCFWVLDHLKNLTCRVFFKTLRNGLRSIAPIILSHFPVEEPRPDAPMVEAAQARTTSSCPVGRLSSCLSMRALSQNPHQ